MVRVADRRRARRVRLATTVTTTVHGSLVDAFGADLSAGGMRLVAPREVRVGAPVSLVFFLNGDIVGAAGVVRWSTRTPRGLYAFGVVFTSMDDDGAALVAKWCRDSIS
jgi:hypothetical protein